MTTIGYSAFRNCYRLTSITIPDSVTSIGSSAFSGCSSLTNIIIPDGVTSIGDYAFSGCDSLKYNEYDNVYYIGNATNKYVVLMKVKLNGITRCDIKGNCKIIYSSAFESCKKLTSVTIPNSVTTIGSSAFSGCSLLVHISLPKNVISVGSYAFSGCRMLGSLNIPNSVTTIGSYVFQNCSNIEKIYYEGSKEQWNKIEKGANWNYVLSNYNVAVIYKVK